MKERCFPGSTFNVGNALENMLLLPKTSKSIVTFSLSEYSSSNKMLKDVEFAANGAFPVMFQENSSNDSQDGRFSAVAFTTVGEAGAPSSAILLTNPSYVKTDPAVTFSAMLVSLADNVWLPTTMENSIETPEKPTTSEAISLSEKVCGGSTSELKGGVVPVKARVSASKDIHEGRGLSSLLLIA